MFKFFVIFLLYQIVNGNPINDLPITFEDANQLESPWLALIQIYDLVCGGNLVKGKYLVTAAHCFDAINPEDFDDEEKLRSAITIKLGEWKTDMDPDCDDDVDEQICEPVVVIRPKSIIRHESYEPEKIENKYESDIAMIKLAWPPRTSGLITSIKLPESDECEASVENQTWTVTGFGQTPARVFTTIKKKIELKMISEEECDDIIQQDDTVYYDKATHICGKGTRDESTCIGDSGSGATRATDDEVTLQGIVSFGTSECGTRGAPSGLLKIACYIDWIKESIETFKSRDGSAGDDDDNNNNDDNNDDNDNEDDNNEENNNNDNNDNNNNNNNTDENGSKDTNEDTNNSNDDNSSDDADNDDQDGTGRSLREKSHAERLMSQHVRRPQ